ncbi:MAG: hypothetical protein AAB702_00190 [Patescibacteria group bacterium]
MKKVILPTAFFLLTPLVLILSLSLLSYLYKGSTDLSAKAPKVAYAALPRASGTLKMNVTSEDMRITIVRDFFKKHKSALIPYADEVIAAADKYEIDYRLIPAIAMQESNLCKKIIKDSYNCWGFGIYGKKVTRFDNYNQAINTVTKTLAIQYKSKGLETPEQIMTKYTPGSNGAWADSVNHFMDQLDITL